MKKLSFFTNILYKIKIPIGVFIKDQKLKILKNYSKNKMQPFSAFIK